MSSRFAKITVIFERREDGGLRAYSDEVPGFVLSHSDSRLVLADVKPALEGILSGMMHAAVTVEPLGSLAGLEDAGLLDASPTMDRIRKEYVGLLVAA